MKRIFVFLLITFVVYSCSSEINSGLKEGGTTAGEYYGQVKTRMSNWSSGFFEWFSDRTNRVEKVREKTMSTIEEIKEGIANAKSTYDAMRQQVDQKIADVQDAKKQLEEAKSAIDKLLRVNESTASNRSAGSSESTGSPESPQSPDSTESVGSTESVETGLDATTRAELEELKRQIEELLKEQE